MSWKEKARERVREKQQGGKFTLAEGENIIRILPNPKGEEYPPFHEYRVHKNVGPDKRMVRCLKSISGKGECWLCRKIEELQNSGNRAKINAAAEMAASDMMLVQIAKVDEKTGKLSGPYVWRMGNVGGKSMGVKLQALLAKEGRTYEHPTKGRNLTITRTGQGLNTTYGSFEPDDEPSKVPQSILDKLKPFSELVSKDNEQTQKDAFFGRSKKRDEDDEEEAPKKRTDDEEDEDEEEDEAPAKSKSKSKSKDEEEEEESEDEDEEEEDSEDEDEEEDEAPAKAKSKSKSKSKGKSKDEEDEEEEDSEDEDEEEDSEDEDEEEDSEDEDEEEEDSEDEDEEEEDSEDEEEEEEEEAPPPKKSAKKAPAKKAATKKAATKGAAKKARK